MIEKIELYDTISTCFVIYPVTKLQVRININENKDNE